MIKTKIAVLTLFAFFCLSVFGFTVDSIAQRQMKELNVYSLSPVQISLPIVSIDQEHIQSASYNTPADALSSLTGISIVRDGAWATSINVRGMNEQRLLFLHDGDRLQSATDVAGVLSTVDMNSLERIDVVKGASSVLYGAGAMGGVVNFISKRPDYSARLQSTAKIISGFQTVNKLWGNSANINFTDHNWYIALDGSYRTAGNTTTPTATIQNSQFNDASWSLKGGMKYDDNQEIKVNYSHFGAWDVGIPGGNAFPQAANVRYASIERNQLDGEYIFTNLTPLVKDLRFKAYTQNISRDVEMKPNDNLLVLPGSLNTTSGVKASSNLFFNEYNNVTVGVESWLRDSESARTKIMLGADTTFIGEIPTPKAAMLDLGAFVLYNKVLDPHYLNLNLGVRADYIKTDNDTSFNQVFKYTIANGEKVPVSFQKNTVFDASTHHDFAYAAHIDLNYTPAKRHIISLSLANAYRVASIEERFKYINLGTGVHYGNPALQAENGFFSNLSYNLTLNKLLFKVDFFANYIFDMIAEEEINGSDYQYNNIDEALFAGAEMDLDWLIARNLKFHTNASYVYTRNVSEQTALPMIPPAHGNVSLNYRLNKLMNTAFSARWSADQNQLAANEVATKGHIVFDFDMQSEAIKIQSISMYLFAGVDNILDTAYKNHLFNNRGLDFYEPGRNLFVKMKLGW